ncbi:agmatinase [Stella humosa]|uniref:Agmatinase n=1 Tax=Stella humosa TaxID=94 RepID=A0A3N1M7S4_9PROT|nr:agmatinase [Stella humosa]ROQ01882.1 agmatinase [Stella humosa]BBK32271.1 agmatinase [Stella humosa]
MNPTFATPPTFLGTLRTDSQARFVTAGIPYDIGTTNRAGTRFGPAAIRTASRMLVDGVNPWQWTAPAELDLADIGDFEIMLGDIRESLRLIEMRAAALSGHLVALGGDHTVTLPLLRGLAPRTGPLGLVHFDAHVDTWPDSFGQPMGHGSVFYHAINEGLVDPRRMIQIGIRSPVGRDVWDWTVGQGVTILPAEECHRLGVDGVVEQIRRVTGDGATYLTFDIDAIDPSQAPGTGTPEIGGLWTWQAQAIIRRLGGIDWRGMDVVEVSPPYDSAEITALAAATFAFEYLSLFRAD